ncbi:MAG: phage tail assembly protein [Gammaproteobacteria bacterium]|nr:phage tail assembly protein [Gammaproteobacteria bacterium]NNJ83488.1 phage tail assembly protein [Gammaproteobacteria bacterium]
MTVKTIQLNSPLTIHGETIAALTMRPPKVRDRLIVEKGSGGPAEKEARFIANLCDVAPDTIEELELADYIKLQDAVNDFLS